MAIAHIWGACWPCSPRVDDGAQRQQLPGGSPHASFQQPQLRAAAAGALHAQVCAPPAVRLACLAGHGDGASSAARSSPYGMPSLPAPLLPLRSCPAPPPLPRPPHGKGGTASCPAGWPAPAQTLRRQRPCPAPACRSWGPARPRTGARGRRTSAPRAAQPGCRQRRRGLQRSGASAPACPRGCRRGRGCGRARCSTKGAYLFCSKNNKSTECKDCHAAKPESQLPSRTGTCRAVHSGMSPLHDRGGMQHCQLSPRQGLARNSRMRHAIRLLHARLCSPPQPLASLMM